MKEFCMNNQVLVFMILSVLVVGLVSLIKIPFKKWTKKMQDEKLRKSLNSFLTILATVIGVAAAAAYSALTGTEFSWEITTIMGNMGLGAYSYVEMFRNWIKYLIDHHKKKKALKLNEVTDIAKDNKVKETEVGEVVEEFKDIDEKIAEYKEKLKE